MEQPHDQGVLPQSESIQFEWPLSASPSTSTLTAIVKGAGPSGLAAALSLIDAGFESTHVLVVERRNDRPEGYGRRNMVAIRPEGLRRLDDFGCLQYARERNWITDLKEGKTFNEWNVDLEGGGIFQWPIGRYESGMEVLNSTEVKVDEKEVEGGEWIKLETGEVAVNNVGVDAAAEDETSKQTQSFLEKGTYTKPGKIGEQVPCCFIDLGHLEDILLQAAERKGIQIRWSSSIELIRDDNFDSTPMQGSKTSDDEIRYRATLVEYPDIGLDVGRTDLGCPDLIICASGKSDHTLEKELGFRRLIGLKLEDEHLPPKGARALNVTAKDEYGMESQLFSVFGVNTPTREMGIIDHVVRKKDSGHPEQPVTDIQMRHAGSTHCLIQLPRGTSTGENKTELDRFLTHRINANLGTNFGTVDNIKTSGLLLWGEPLSPIVVETSTAPQYVFGNNVLLIGDAAMSCSPSSGLGADIGMTVDSRSLYDLASSLIKLRRSERDQETVSSMSENKLKLLEDFNRRKAEASVIWSQGSRWFYVSRAEADKILAAKETSTADAEPEPQSESKPQVNGVSGGEPVKNMLLQDW